MRRVNHTLTYPGTTVDEVYAMFANSAFRKAVSDDQRVIEFSCDIMPSGVGMTVRLEEAHGTDRIPSFAQKLVGHEIRFIREESWSAPSGADVVVTIPDKPADMTGSTSLTQTGDDVIQQIELAVKVSLPLVGGKLESLVADFVRKAFDAENRVGITWLGGEWRA